MDIVIYLFIVMIIAGAVALLIRKAPFIDEEYKPYLLWLLLAVVVFVIIYALLPFARGVSLPSPRR